MRPRTPAREVSRAVAAWEAHGRRTSEAAASLGVSRHAMGRMLRAAGVLPGRPRKGEPPAGPAPPPDDAPFVRTEEGDTARVRFDADHEVRTVEDALRHAEVDTTVWRVKRFQVTAWQVGMKLREFGGKSVVSERPETRQLWRVHLELERILPRPRREALDAVFDAMSRRAPKYPPLPRARQSRPHLCVVGLVDAHFGKMAWARETGQDYDLRLADRVYRDAVEDHLDRARGYDVEEFLVPIGSDFLHIDNLANATTGGTPQDVDGRLAKIIEVASLAFINGVEAMAARARVVVRWVPGNHDWLVSHCLAREVAAWFRHARHVEVDASPPPRKYHRYHATLIGLAHGNEERREKLPALMALERKKDWAETSCREWHLGHEHRPRRQDHFALDTDGGVTVRTLPSLSATDAWHFRRGFVGTSRASEAYFYDRGGFAGHNVARVRGS